MKIDTHTLHEDCLAFGNKNLSAGHSTDIYHIMARDLPFIGNFNTQDALPIVQVMRRTATHSIFASKKAGKQETMPYQFFWMNDRLCGRCKAVF